jgi:hypothetical protein
MRNRTQERVKPRKTFNEAIPFEMMAMEPARIRSIQENAVCLDISESGLGLTADLAPKKGAVLKVFLPIQKVGINLPVFAEVVWSARSNGHFRMGLRVLQ